MLLFMLQFAACVFRFAITNITLLKTTDSQIDVQLQLSENCCVPILIKSFKTYRNCQTCGS